jgi:hypothetical protein
MNRKHDFVSNGHASVGRHGTVLVDHDPKFSSVTFQRAMSDIGFDVLYSPVHSPITHGWSGVVFVDAVYHHPAFERAVKDFGLCVVRTPATHAQVLDALARQRGSRSGRAARKSRRRGK